MKNTPEVWEKHWNELRREKKFFNHFLQVYRKYLIAPAVKYYLNKHFNKEGVYLECGVGTGQTLQKLKKENQKFYAIDFSKTALEEAKKIKQIDKCILADIKKLPFKTNSIDGIWNLGTMEHFKKEELDEALLEFKRVLKLGCKAIMFWPIKYAPYEILMNNTIWIAKKIFYKDINPFPDEPSILNNKKEAKQIILKIGFNECEVHFNMRDMFTYAVVIAKK